jgi:tRNA A37 methylthiotransferase MiaB
VFGYSDEDGTEAESLPGHLDETEVARRVEEVADLAEELMAQRGADRIGQTVDVLIEEKVGDGEYEGRSAHQAPEVDGSTTVRTDRELAPGQMVRATVISSDGVDLTATPSASAAPAAPAQDPVRLSTARSLADRR